MSKQKINELNVVSRFIGDFFDGIKTNTTNRFLDKARKQGIPKPILDKMAKIDKETKELDAIIAKYSK
jgi:hypothetical protein